MQFFDGCPHWNLAEERLRQAMTDVGRDDVEVIYQRIDSPEDAERLDFHGSPTLLISGRDVFAKRDMPVIFGCRNMKPSKGLNVHRRWLNSATCCDRHRESCQSYPWGV